MKQLVTLAWFAAFVLAPCSKAWAGGPRHVAGSSYFDPAAKGEPIVWANGQVAYFTDLGNLSASVNQSQANAMVAAAAAAWNAVPTAGVNLYPGGNLAEDVSGANVIPGTNEPSIPADIQADNTAEPVAIVYDEDGSVIDAYFGTGASDPSQCQHDGVFTFLDNLAPSGNIVHALMLVNGLCATNTTQIGVLQYQLVRAFGQVLGLDWSQANEEMFASGQITSAGLPGWPIMHPVERLCNASGQSCMTSGTTLRPDDIAALNRLYPVTAANLATFPGKELTAENTISVRGTIQFRNGEGMQGVNVVLRPIDPSTGVPDVRYTVTAVSGAAFQGNIGNAVTGTTDASGNPLNRFGSDDSALEGSFDLSGIPIPLDYPSGVWQLSFEPVNPLYLGAESVGPYTTGQVTPSGTMPTLTLPGLAAGASVEQTITISNSAGNSFSGNDGTETAPISIAPNGEWTARLTGYGHASWLQWWAKANREFTVEAQAVDENGHPTTGKVQLVVGMWNGTDSAASPPVTDTPQPFNGAVTGLTTLPVLTLADSEVRLGAADLRGDGRPDYLYRGRILYADMVQPTSLPASGGPIVIQGMGFRSDSVVLVNGINAAVTSVSPTEITAIAPASTATGNVPVEVKDPETLGVAIIADELSYGAQNSDTLAIVAAPSGQIAASKPQSFTVRASNGSSPTAGITVTYTVTQGTARLGCGQAQCSVVTVADGTATLSVTAVSAAPALVTASLSNGASVTTTFGGTTAPVISALTPNLYLAIGAILQWNPQALVLNNGMPVANATVTWTPATDGVIAPTSASLSNTEGIVTQQLTAGPLVANQIVPVEACLAGSSGCAQFSVMAVDPATAQLSALNGISQSIPAAQYFAPVVLRVSDPSGDPLAGAIVTFYQTLNAWTPTCPAQGICPPAPLLEQETAQAISAADGTVTLHPISNAGQPSRLHVTAVTGNNGILTFVLEQHP